METLARDVRYAVRALARTRGLAVAAILTLAVGIGGTTTMFSVVHATLLRPVPFPEPDRIVIPFNTVVTPRESLIRLRWSRPNIVALTATVRSLETIASFTPALVAISGGNDEPEQIDGEVVSPEYFRALRETPLAGRTFRPEEDTPAGAQPVTVLSERLWRRRFGGDAALVGRTIRVNDVPLTVVGILREPFGGLSGKAQLWIPPTMAARLTYADYLTTPQHFIGVVARLKPGVTIAQANAELAAIGPRFADETSPPDAVWSATAVPIGDARVDPIVRRSALVLLAAAACVLIIACVNVASLLLARARTRRREMAVRLAIGSSRRRLVQQLLTEGLVMALAAGVIGLVIASWGVAWFARTAPAVIPGGRNNYAAVGTFGNPALDLTVLVFALAVTIGTTVLFALAPALQASRSDLITALKQDERGGGREGRGLSALVVSEVALACLLLTTAGLLVQNVAQIQGRRTGFVAAGVLTFWIRPPTARYVYPDGGPAIVERVLTRIQAVPGVTSAAVNRCTPFSGCSRSVVFVAGHPTDVLNAPGVGRHYVSSDYFKTLGIPLLAGRALTASDRAGSPPVAVVNEAGARRFWPGESPIGKRVWFGTTTGPFSDPAHSVEIVGMVGNVKYEGVDQADVPERAEFYTSYLQFSYPDTMVIVKAAAPLSLVPSIRQAVASVDASLPIYDVMMLDDRIGAAISRPRFNAVLLAAFAGAALLLAAIGVYGVLSYAVSSRLREIGVRLALGADPRRVISLVLGRGLRLAGIGASIGLVAALASARLLRGLVVDVSPSDPRLLAASVVVVTVVAAVAAFLPARRASLVDPIVVLRAE